MFSNIGVSGAAPSVYLTSDPFISDFFYVYGGDLASYPAHHPTEPQPTPANPLLLPGEQYTGATDQKWFFTYHSDIGADVPSTEAIDRVDVTFWAKLTYAKTLVPYFKTGGLKYYLSTYTSDQFDYLQYGGGGIGFGVQNNSEFTYYWTFNPATGAPWTLAAITAGEFGFETNGGNVDLHGAFLQIFFGWGGGFGDTHGVATAGGGVVASECGQTATLADAFNNYDSKILDVTPPYGPIAGATQIAINGYNFVDGSTIKFGTLAATGVQFIDDQHFVATSPAHAQGFVDIVITEPGGAVVTLRNGFQYTLLLRGEDFRRAGMSIRLGLNTGANGCSFTLDGKSQPPRVSEKIQIIDTQVTPNRLMFAGNVQRVTQVYEGLNTQLAWNVEAVDFTWLLNRRRPFGTYANTSVSDIVKDLITRYAPGFSANHVQTNLAKVSITFDGSWDLTTCFSALARMIGGGHWYVDFIEDLHFFHVVPPVLQLPTLPTSTTIRTTFEESSGLQRLGPGSAMTVVQGALITDTFRFDPGMYEFFSTFVYDNGVESAYSPVAGPVGLDGAHKVTFSNIPVGAAAGALTVIRRRIYSIYNGNLGGGQVLPFCSVNDNVTTGFTTNFRSVGASVAVVGPLTGHNPPAIPFVTPPAYDSTTPMVASISLTAALLHQTECRPTTVTQALTWTPGSWRFKVANIYQDLTESQLSPVSNTVVSDGANMIHLQGIPLGLTINSVPVIARRIYGAIGPTDADFVSWWIVPNNTAISADIAPATGSKTTAPSASIVSVAAPDKPNIPVWPNADGPSLEDFDLPDEVVDDNPYLLRDPQVTSEVDLSQIRNRVFLRGAGSSAVTAVAVGATTIRVADCSYYSRTGGQVFVEGRVLDYLSTSVETGSGDLRLAFATTVAITQGASVVLYLQLDDIASQQDLGKVELDKDGNPTDGVHEYSITDQSLVTMFQMYMRGYAELELYSRPITTVRYATRDPKTRPGARVNINLTNPPIVGEFLIQNVTIDQIHDESDVLTPRYNVTTSSSRFDLNDLFFQWNLGVTQRPLTPSISGVIESAVAAVPEGVNPTGTEMRTDLSMANFGTISQPPRVDQVWSSALAGSHSGVADAEGYFMRMAPTGTGAGGETNVLNVPSTAAFYTSQTWRYRCTMRLRDYSNQLSINGKVVFMLLLFDGVNFQYDGLGSGSTPTTTNLARKGIGIRLDYNGWTAYMADGTQVLISSSSGFGQANKYYQLEIRCLPLYNRFDIYWRAMRLTTSGMVVDSASSSSLTLSTGLAGVPLWGFCKLWNDDPGFTTAKTYDWMNFSADRF